MFSTRNAFTLIELMLVVALMGIMGTISVGGYRAMRRGMEERGVEQTVEKFLRLANERAKIDGVPTYVYFANETRECEDSQDSTKRLIVVGHAVAVRRVGRASRSESGYLVDEFGDLQHYVLRDSNGNAKEASDDGGMTMYKLVGSGTGRKVAQVSQNAEVYYGNQLEMMSDFGWNKHVTSSDDSTHERLYRYKILDGESWNAGEGYGVEFADIVLPNNYIFGSGSGDYNDNKTDDFTKWQSEGMYFDRTSGSGSIVVSAIRSNKETGAPVVQTLRTMKASTIQEND